MLADAAPAYVTNGHAALNNDKIGAARQFARLNKN
jgi:hypothetical protein